MRRWQGEGRKEERNRVRWRREGKFKEKRGRERESRKGRKGEG